MNIVRTIASVSTLTFAAALSAACSGDLPPERAGEEGAEVVLEAATVRPCAEQCAMSYTACFQFSGGDACGCYPQYVSCMKNRCRLGPAFTAPECLDAGGPPPPPPDASGPPACPVECHCPTGDSCTNTCQQCKDRCNVRPPFNPCG